MAPQHVYSTFVPILKQEMPKRQSQSEQTNQYNCYPSFIHGFLSYSFAETEEENKQTQTHTQQQMNENVNLSNPTSVLDSYVSKMDETSKNQLRSFVSDLLNGKQIHVENKQTQQQEQQTMEPKIEQTQQTLTETDHAFQNELRQNNLLLLKLQIAQNERTGLVSEEEKYLGLFVVCFCLVFVCSFVCFCVLK
jgi:hypothetical protein